MSVGDNFRALSVGCRTLVLCRQTGVSTQVTGLPRLRGGCSATVALAAVAAAVDGLLAVDLSLPGTAELLDLLREVERQSRRLAAASVAVIGQIDARGVAAPEGCQSTAALVRQVIMIGKDESSRRARLAAGICPSTGLSGAAVPARFPLVGAAVTAGEVAVREAALICSTITGFPRHHPPTVVEAAEQFLVDQAAVLDPKTFKQTAREIALMANPDGTPDDRDAHEKMEFHLGRRREDGLTRCWGLLDDLTAEALRAAFGSMCSPSAERRNDRVDVQWPSDPDDGDGDQGEANGGIDPDPTQPSAPDQDGHSASDDDAVGPFLPDSTEQAADVPLDVVPDVHATGERDEAADPDVDHETGPDADNGADDAEEQPSNEPTPSDLPPARGDQTDDLAPAIPGSGESQTTPTGPDQPPMSRIGIYGSDPGPAAGRVGGRPPDPPPEPAPAAPDASTGVVEGCQRNGFVAAAPPDHTDGRPPDSPCDCAPAAAPYLSTGAAEGCPDDDLGLGQLAAVGQVWRAPRLPYEWAPLGSVPSDYHPPPGSTETLPDVPDGATLASAGGTPMPGPPSDRRSAGTKRAQALSIILTTFLDLGVAPTQGGQRPHIVVTIDEQSLTDRTRPARLGFGDQLPAGQLRMLACDAKIIPAVLGGASEVLDVGRSMRTFTAACRTAILLRDVGCVFPGCGMPGRWAEFHHIQHWADGGPSDLHNGCLLCKRHHMLIHQEQWQVRMGADRLPEIIPPTSHDLEQRPLRNTQHRPPVFAWPQVG